MSSPGSRTNRVLEHERLRDGLKDEARTIGALLKELRDEMILLFREEVALAKAETAQKAAKFGRNAGYLAVGAAIALAGVLFLVAAAVAGVYAALVAAGLSSLVAVWLAPLVVGLIAGLVGYGLIKKAISTFENESLVPERTVQSLQEDKDWIQEKVQ
ncbi:hypothetical protein Mal4_13200 [Maioricimonas rarisocia]|uniref:Phage holin family protein n=1 Tax=Maioricimonas rarisocia TaxID=2528026 RepID=A0A517Z3K6_9PLAN|nr:phage holin family protein [Maioricimonas rarisocia]QDU37017.1 hypothetical protein Mal4_13200 [Maioricimonas rarisocia]